MEKRWLTDDERVAWVRLAAVLELLPGVLDTQLRRDADLSHFEYFVLAMLSEAPGRRGFSGWTAERGSITTRAHPTILCIGHFSSHGALGHPDAVVRGIRQDR